MSDNGPTKPVWYITTPIYYVNGKPHVGSGLTTVCCDALARYHEMRGRSTWFVTGTDEQATKVLEAANKASVPTQEFADRLAGEFQQAWADLHVAYDDFIRTTEPRHVEAVQEFFRRLVERGDVYKGLYEGWYCVSDETFFRDSDVGPDRLCPNAECRKPLERVQEENYFFRLSAYESRLLEHIEGNPGFLQPEFRRNEVISFIRQGLRDMSITRSNPGWGIPVPGEPDKVIYVWFDALISYLAATGWPADEARSAMLWPADVHLMAKEIFVRFHATLWPAMLMALDLPLPGTVYAHGWWVDAEGKKEGKRTGGLPHPSELARWISMASGGSLDLAADAVRYLLLREMQFHGDSEFSLNTFFRRYNTDLANDLGNLCNRAVTMVSRYFSGLVPAPVAQDQEIAALAGEVVGEYESALEDFRFNAALEAVWRLVSRMNRYIEDRRPWSQAKAGDSDGLSTTLYTCLEAVRVVATLLAPVMPVAAKALYEQIGINPEEYSPRWEDAHLWGLLAPGVQIAKPAPVFPRMQGDAWEGASGEKEADVKPAEEQTATGEPRSGGAEEKAAAAKPPATPNAQGPMSDSASTITIDDFMKVELKVANVLAAEPVPNATKLLKLTVDLGSEQRTILAGIAEMYQPDEMVGKQIVVVANLQPRKMRGIESQGMLLAADVDGQAIVLQPETKVPAGSRVR